MKKQRMLSFIVAAIVLFLVASPALACWVNNFQANADCVGGSAGAQVYEPSPHRFVAEFRDERGRLLARSEKSYPGGQQFEEVTATWTSGMYPEVSVTVSAKITNSNGVIWSGTKVVPVSCPGPEVSLAVNLDCEGAKFTGSAEIALPLYYTTSDHQSGRTIMVGPGEINVVIPWNPPIDSPTPTEVWAIGGLVHNGHDLVTVGDETFLTCFVPRGTLQAEVKCGNAGFAGNANVPMNLSYTMSDGQTGNVPVGPGEYSVEIPWVPPIAGQYGPHAVFAEAKLFYDGNVVAEDKATNTELTCGLPRAELQVEVNCKESLYSGSVETEMTLQYKTSDGQVGQLMVGPGEFNETIAWDPPISEFGPVQLWAEAELQYNSERIAQDRDEQTLTCNNPSFALDTSGSCDSGVASGHADVRVLLRTEGVGPDGKPIGRKEYVEGDFRIEYSWVNPGTYGPHAAQLNAQLFLGTEQVAEDSWEEKALICGEPKLELAIVASCERGDVLGRTDVPAELRVEGTLPDGSSIGFTEQVLGEFKTNLFGEVKDTGDLEFSISAELLVDGQVAKEAHEGGTLKCNREDSCCFVQEQKAASPGTLAMIAESLDGVELEDFWRQHNEISVSGEPLAPEASQKWPPTGRVYKDIFRVDVDPIRDINGNNMIVAIVVKAFNYLGDEDGMGAFGRSDGGMPNQTGTDLYQEAVDGIPGPLGAAHPVRQRNHTLTRIFEGASSSYEVFDVEVPTNDRTELPNEWQLSASNNSAGMLNSYLVWSGFFSGAESVRQAAADSGYYSWLMDSRYAIDRDGFQVWPAQPVKNWIWADAQISSHGWRWTLSNGRSVEFTFVDRPWFVASDGRMILSDEDFYRLLDGQSWGWVTGERGPVKHAREAQDALVELIVAMHAKYGLTGQMSLSGNWSK